RHDQRASRLIGVFPSRGPTARRIALRGPSRGPALEQGSDRHMATTIQSNFRMRKSFAKIPKAIDIPNLIDIQKNSFKQFLQADVAPDHPADYGLQGVF